MATVILSGGADALGTRVRSRLAAERHEVIAVDEGERASELKARVEGATKLVHLAGGLEETRAVLEAASAVGVAHVVLLSSATVYGAWPANPVPLTEDATVRPNPELDFAVRAAERERLAAEWKLEHPATSVVLLRPAVPVAEEAQGWLAEGLRVAATIRIDTVDDPPVQYVHLDDLADAVVLAVDADLDGPLNVAPDGWIAGEQLRALAGGPRVRLPEQLARRLTRLRSKLGPAAAHPGLAPYTTHSWVVANDRIRAAGWSPAWSNEEAFVAGHEPAPWATITPQRRQELALGALVVAVLAAVAGGVALVRRRHRG
ncbi:MAG: NAD-dependent epimerase/dehydratase family protein [Acidimicrobiales bacterium]